MVKIGNVTIEGFAGLAPMAGVADRALREVCRGFGAAWAVGEMASAKGILMGSEKSAELLAPDPERPYAVQLFGTEPGLIAQAARRAEALGPDFIDLNMGCPAPKVVNTGAGSALMKNPALAEKIVRAAVDAVKIPVTVKIRKGFDDGSVNAPEFAKRMEAAGAAAVAVHGRTRAQMYAPPVDLGVIAEVRRAVSVPVIGNGDIAAAKDAKRMLDETGCDLVMIGRGALGAPWLFREISAFLKDGTELPPPPLEERFSVMRRQLILLLEYRGESVGLREARKHAAWYMTGLGGAAALRRECGKISSRADIERIIETALEWNRDGAQPGRG
ncbi:MAG TPA: tRNA dihydrouridine synthase DusB [Candidatus Fimivivens faecavium]|nr:tRNA dihydrouridine synthase DusB [Candidatus Fimivivens faecavium]